MTPTELLAQVFATAPAEREPLTTPVWAAGGPPGASRHTSRTPPPAPRSPPSARPPAPAADRAPVGAGDTPASAARRRAGHRPSPTAGGPRRGLRPSHAGRLPAIGRLGRSTSDAS